MIIKKRIKLGIFGDDLCRRGKGTSVVLQNLVREYTNLLKEEIDLSLICRENIRGNLDYPKVRLILVKIFRLPKLSGFFSYLYFFLFTKEEFDIIHFPRPALHPFFGILKLLGKTKKIVVTFHGAPENDKIPLYQTFFNRFNRSFIRYIGQYFIDAAVADSRSGAEQIAGYYGINKKKITTIYLAAGDSFKPLMVGEKDAARRMLKDKYSIFEPYILSVSRLDPHKNIHRLAQAFLDLKEKEKIPHKLVLVSAKHDPEYSKIVYDIVKNSPYAPEICFMPFVEEDYLRFLYSLADVFVYVSLSEGFGLPLVEAMKCGTPIVTSNISCMPEIIGDAGVLVDPWRFNTISRGIIDVLRDEGLKSTLKERGLRRSEQFSWESSAKAYLNLYENCLRN